MSNRRTIAKFGFVILVVAIAVIIGGEILLMHPTGQQGTLNANVTSGNITIASASLSSGSLDLTIQNNGNGNSMLQEVTVTPVQESNMSAAFFINSSGDIQPLPYSIGNEGYGRFNNSDIPVHFDNGTLTFSNGTVIQSNGTFPSGSYNGSSRFNGSIGNYNGTFPPFNGAYGNGTFSAMNFGYVLPANSSMAFSYNGQISAIIPGEEYAIVVVSEESTATTVVTAS
jgi:hypothetical protein